MTALNFAPSVAIVRDFEGGFVNSPKDPGGATKFGITEFALSSHRGHACTVADVQALQWPEAEAIYQSTYWPAVDGDQMSSGVDLMLFDSAVNCGRRQAVRFLQAALGVVQDGALGVETLRALDDVNDRVGLVGRLRQRRAAFYRSLRSFSTFGPGWLNRLSSVSHTASAWAVKA